MSVTQQQVVTLLENVLFETPTQAAANAGTWINNSAAGSVSTLAAAMANSGEAKIAATVVGYYLASLGRAPNAAEVQYYVGIAEQGLTQAQIAAGQVASTTWDTIGKYFAHSPEFATRGNIDFSLGNTAAYLEAVPWLYQSVLGRAASSAELAYYDNQVINGTDLGTLFREFTASPEFHTDTDAQIAAALASFGTSTVAGTQPPAVAVSVTLGAPPPPPPTSSPVPSPAPSPSFHSLTVAGNDSIDDHLLSGAHTYTAIMNGGSATLNGTDSLTGNGLAELDITDTSGAASHDSLSGITLAGIQTIHVTTSGNVGSGGGVNTFDVSGVTDLTTLVVTSSGANGDWISATSSVDITLTSVSGTVYIRDANTVSITDNNLATLDLSSSVGAVTLHDPTAGSTSLTINTGTLTLTSFTDADNQIQALTIANSGSASTIGAITDTALQTLTVTGSSGVTFGSSSAPIVLGANVTTVDLSLDADLTGTNYFKLGSDNVNFTVPADGTSIDLNGHTNLLITFATSASGLTNMSAPITNDSGGTIITDLLAEIGGPKDVEYGDDGTDTYIVESDDGSATPGTGHVSIIRIVGTGHTIDVSSGTHITLTL